MYLYIVSLFILSLVHQIYSLKLITIHINCLERTLRVENDFVTIRFGFTNKNYCVVDEDSSLESNLNSIAEFDPDFVLIEDIHYSTEYLDYFKKNLDIPIYLFYYCGHSLCTYSTIHDLCPIKMVEKSLIYFEKKKFFGSVYNKKYRFIESPVHSIVNLLNLKILFEIEEDMKAFENILTKISPEDCRNLLIYSYYHKYEEIILVTEIFHNSNCQISGALLIQVYPINEQEIIENKAIFKNVYILNSFINKNNIELENLLELFGIDTDIEYFDSFSYYLYSICYIYKEEILNNGIDILHVSNLFSRLKGRDILTELGLIRFLTAYLSITRESFLVKVNEIGELAIYYTLNTLISNEPTFYENINCIGEIYQDYNPHYFGYLSNDKQIESSKETFMGFYIGLEDILLVYY